MDPITAVRDDSSSAFATVEPKGYPSRAIWKAQRERAIERAAAPACLPANGAGDGYRLRLNPSYSLRERGKLAKVALVACMRKLLTIVNARRRDELTAGASMAT